MDLNFKLNKLYLFSDLTISKLVNEDINYPTFKETRTNDQFDVDINSKTLICIELFFKIEEKYKSNLRANYYAFQFLTDLFQLVFHRHSNLNLVQPRESYDATLISNRNNFDCVLEYEDKFILKEDTKQVEDILISNFERKVAEPILVKHNRLFECL